MDLGSSLSRSFDVLSHYRRRLVLYHLLETFDGRASLDALTDIIVAESEELDMTPEAHRRTMVSLQHVHLPKLVAMGVIEHDEEENMVRLRTPSSMLDRLLDLCLDYETYDHCQN
ncbi:DUF7344 domain-containing protein [Haladaptatus sp.]|uniref:DUF7344 domain-containing protein n=1 Tax=Haladaptatus sp. TaxID=1973141 RepID=UPI003C3E76E9